MAELAFTPTLLDTPAIDHPRFSARCRPAQTLLELRGTTQALANRLPGWIPLAPNDCQARGEWRIAHVRPDAWWLLHADFAASAESLPQGRELEARGLLIDLSHSRTCVRVSGPAMRSVLASGTPLDLRPARFAVGQCATTWCAGIGVFLEVRDSGIDILVTNSGVRAFWEWLTDAVAEYGE
jgi:heterotetrameric sarcosine oxidase gamma subunit